MTIDGAMAGARRKREARIFTACVLTAIAALGGSQIGSGRDVSQPLEPATSPSSASAAPAAYSVTVSNQGSVVLVRRERHACFGCRRPSGG